MIDSNLVEKSEVDVQQRVKDFEFFEQWVFVTPQQVTDPERLEHADAQGFHQVRDGVTEDAIFEFLHHGLKSKTHKHSESAHLRHHFFMQYIISYCYFDFGMKCDMLFYEISVVLVCQIIISPQRGC